MVVFDVYQPICSGSMYLSLAPFFVSGLIKSPFLRGRTVCSTRGCHARIEVSASNSANDFHIVVNASKTACSVVTNSVACYIAIGKVRLT